MGTLGRIYRFSNSILNSDMLGVGRKVSKSYIMAATGMGSILDLSSSSATVLPLSISSTVIKKRNNIFVKVNQSAFQERLNLCKFSLIARFF